MRNLLIGLLITLFATGAVYAKEENSKYTHALKSETVLINSQRSLIPTTTKITETPEITIDSILPNWILVVLAMGMGIGVQILVADVMQQRLNVNFIFVVFIMTALSCGILAAYAIVFGQSLMQVVFYSLFHVGLATVSYYLTTRWVRYRTSE